MFFTRSIAFILILFVLSTCERNTLSIQIKADQVKEGEFSAYTKGPTTMVSDYPMNREQGLPQPIVFKLSLNREDNEAGFGQNHQLVVPPGITEYFAPTLRFGEPIPSTQSRAPDLNQPATVHFRIDLRPVLRSFTSHHYYVAPTRDTLFAHEFEGLYLAGGTKPLRWIWDDPDSADHLRFEDSDQDSIYELIVKFNPFTPPRTERLWNLSKDLSKLPQFSSPQAPLLEAITNLALEEVVMNIRDDGAFSAGEAWKGVWTRDISYAAQLSLAYLFPENVKTSLRAKLTPRGRIIQDTGTGGSWPVSSDRHIWTLAAWEVFLATGDSLWLDEIREPVLQALEEDLLWNRDPVSGMLLGETSFEDWREQTYPVWMTPADIHGSHALSTNIIFKRALEIGLTLTKTDGTISRSWPQLISRLDQNILNHFWNPNLQAPASYIIATPAWLPAPHRDLLGESLGILFCNSFSQVDSQLVATYPRTVYGSPVISHQLPDSPAYHNQAIWPFVEAYALLAAKKAGNQTAYLHGFNSLIRAAGLFLSHRENFQFMSGRPDQTEINSDRQLWSSAGWLGAVYKGLFGLSLNYNYDTRVFELLLSPDNPFQWRTFSLTALTLHNTNISVKLSGRGNVVTSMKVNGKDYEPGSALPLTGEALDIVIELEKNPSDTLSKIKITSYFQPPMPQNIWLADTLLWSGPQKVLLELNGRLLDTLKTSPLVIPDSLSGFFTLRSEDARGIQSLPTAPHYLGPSAMLVLNSKAPYYVELGHENAFLQLSFSLPTQGNYLMRFTYANGSGPLNTGSTCGVAKLTINDWWLEQMVSFPHTARWDIWQTTAWAKAKFNAGNNTIILDQEALPTSNMDGSINLFRVRNVEIVPISE